MEGGPSAGGSVVVPAVHPAFQRSTSGMSSSSVAEPLQLFRMLSSRPFPAREGMVSEGAILRRFWEAAPDGSVSVFTPNSLRLFRRSRSREDLNPAIPASHPSFAEGAERMEPQPSFYVPGIDDNALGQLRATAIAGNDISSSCLYATGLVAQSAGIYGVFASLLVCVTLNLFRNIYSEVFSALPMNGGTYTALLNTFQTKNAATLAAILSTLSYTATAVTSAASAANYLNSELASLNAEAVTIFILCFFAFLTLMGIKDSANVATALFLVHLTTMASLIVAALVYVIRDDGTILLQSWHSTGHEANPHSTIAGNLFFGFCSALLGVTGFESSSNYIEEQREGVFPKTLRNMWIIITAINPALSLLSMGVLPIEKLVLQSDYALAVVGEICVGQWFRKLIVADAALVLSGAVLTSYVGITGLHRRLALDRIMPPWFLVTNELRGTNHVIIISFCVLAVSLRLLVSDMSVLGGVYAIAFLGVMMLFCISNLAMKLNRERLRRSPVAPLWSVGIAFCLVAAGFVGNLIKSPQNAQYFILYFLVFSAIVLSAAAQKPMLLFVERLTSGGRDPRSGPPTAAEPDMSSLVPVPGLRSRINFACQQRIHAINNWPIVFFTNTASLHTLNKVVHYVIRNEDTHNIKIVNFFGHNIPELPELGNQANFLDALEVSERNFMANLEHECAIIDRLHPKITIELLFIHGEFCPYTVDTLSEQLGIPKNFMLMTCPGDRFPHQIGQFGGMRVVTH
ncbi:unnamed protein product [Polarella glacialis]|uniref:Amino acid permease/ SLC12A domain-containing protein n=1 Tax=Polarella glacialis TaxID=89957 RepID=A0A813EB28_POLGL|nr:unnamed protein product [Polarella glacialis]